MSLVAARFLLGIGEGSAFPTATRALANWMAADRRGFAQGITHAAARLGNALTPPLIAFLIVALSWRDSFIIIGVISFAWVGLWWFYFRDDPRDHKGVTEEEIAVLPAGEDSGRTPRGAVGAAAPPMLPVTLTDFCYGWTLWLFLNWIPSYFLHNIISTSRNPRSLPRASSSQASSETRWARRQRQDPEADGRRLQGPRQRHRRRLPRGLRLHAAGAVHHRPAPITLCLSGAFFFAELIVAPIWAVPMDIAPQYSGTASGFMNFGFGLAGMISPSCSG